MGLTKFWDFVTERQRIWHARRVAGEPAPWTEDPILRDKRFTNVYRLLDKGTLFPLYEIIAGPGSDQERVFQVVAYRLLNRIDSYLALRQPLAKWNRQAFEAGVAARRDAGLPVLTAAFVPVTMVTGGHGEKGVLPKIAGAIEVVRGRIGDFVTELRSCATPQEAHQAIRNMGGLYKTGPFISYQILLDLMYPAKDDGTAVLPQLDADSWVYMGPGSTKSIGTTAKQLGLKAHELCGVWHEMQYDALESRGFKFLRARNGAPVGLSLADVEHGLCEWYKYRNLLKGGNVKPNAGPGEYSPPRPVPQWLEVPE